MSHSRIIAEQQRALSQDLVVNFKISDVYNSSWLKEGCAVGFDSGAEHIIEYYLSKKSWWMIDWQLILGKNAALWLIVSMLTPLGYRQLFPSFLEHCIYHQNTSLLSDLFIESCLIISNAHDSDQLDFYSSLTEQQAICVANVLDYAKHHGNALAAEALDSYWGAFL